MSKESHGKRAREPDRPPFVRFAAMLRVDYPTGARTAFAYTAQLSSGDMILRARNLTEGDSLVFKLALSKTLTLDLSGKVGGPEGDGVLVTFADGQDEAIYAVRSYLESHHVKELEESVNKSVRFPDRALQLAAWYREVGRDEEALWLLGRYCDNNPKHLGLAEAAAATLVDRIEAGVAGRDVLDALAGIVDRSRQLGESAAIDRAAKALADARRDFEKRKVEEARKAAEAEKKAQEDKLAKLREKIFAEAESKARESFAKRNA